MAKIDFSKLKRAYLDTALYIYFFEDNPRFGKKVEALLLRLEEKKTKIIASNLLLTELLIAPLRENREDLVKIYKNLADYIPNLEYLPLDRKIGIIGAELRADYNLRTPDAIHIATAIAGKAGAFFTADKEIRKVKEIEIVLI